MNLPPVAQRYFWAARVLWVALRVVMAFWMARTGIHFYYQGF